MLHDQELEPTLFQKYKVNTAAGLGATNSMQRPRVRMAPAEPDRTGVLALIGLALCFVFIFTAQSIAQSSAESPPENAHLIRYGDGWECDLQFRRDGDQCVALEVPENAFPTNRTYGSGWECYRGFENVDDTTCREIVVPPGAFLTASGTRWRCLRGFQKIGETCELIDLPDHAYLTAETDDSAWECDRGYKKSSEGCSKIHVPENAYLTNASYGDAWKCERGFRKTEDACLPVAAPANGYFDDTSYGPGWKCERGYAASNGACVAMDLPENAHLDRSGNRWECDRGYRRSKGACIMGN
jgi:hypothetical protein